MHEAYRTMAIRNKDPQKEIYGCFYLFSDYLTIPDYTMATRCVLEAETIANSTNNKGWQGMVAHLKGVIDVRMRKYADAIIPYEQAVVLCRQAGDSLCVGESLEQIAAMHLRLMDFEKAQHYFDLALPLIEKYGEGASAATALNNIGLFYFHQERYLEAIPYFQRAITKFNKHQEHKREAQALNNLAATYNSLKRFKEAIAIYHQCISLNTEFQQYDNMITNYSGMNQLYEETGDFAQAYEYLVKYHLLRDSLIGAKTQKEIADLEGKYSSQQKDLELQKSQTALITSQRMVEREFGLLLFVLALVTFGIWRWYEQARRAKEIRIQNQEALTDLIHVLSEKNALLADLEARIDAEKDTTPDEEDFEGSLYNQRILTHDDWDLFKGYFEKSYPGYLLRLRGVFPELSEAEERLFLFVKLNLTTREAASILGISVDSVKKTRNRLRHRLALGEETELEVFIRAF